MTIKESETMMRYQTICRAMSLVAGCLLALGGCKSSEPPKSDGSSMAEFFPKYEEHSIHNFALVQTSNGARADSMLFPLCFDGAELNVLGREQLDSMVDANPDRVTTIYLNFPESEMMDQRRDAVLAYMGSKGVQESNLKFVSGPNPSRMTPAAGGLTRLPRTESVAGSEAADPGMVQPNPANQ